MIQFNCEKCNRAYRVSDNYAGKRVRCKQCNAINLIPCAERELISCGNSIAAYNQLLKKLGREERLRPAIETDE